MYSPNNVVFWYLMVCSPIDVYIHIGGSRYLRDLQWWRHVLPKPWHQSTKLHSVTPHMYLNNYKYGDCAEL
jgi:hypothetical protein